MIYYLQRTENTLNSDLNYHLVPSTTYCASGGKLVKKPIKDRVHLNSVMNPIDFKKIYAELKTMQVNEIRQIEL